MLDEHSRLLLPRRLSGPTDGDRAGRLSRAFRIYGLPRRVLCDNDPPWGSDAQHRFTRLGAWLTRLCIQVSHGRPYHPQTQGKDERFHRTLKDERLLRQEPGWRDLEDVQASFDLYRQHYNEYRPHQALGGIPPLWRYSASPRPLLDGLPEPAYEAGDLLRVVSRDRRFSFGGQDYRVGNAFVGQTVALRAKAQGGWDVYYCWQHIGRLDPSSPRLLQV